MSIYFNTGMAVTNSQIALPDSAAVTFWMYLKGWSGGVSNRFFGSETGFEVTIPQAKDHVMNKLYNTVGLEGTTAINLNTWYHVGCTACRNAGIAETYINGILDASANNHTYTPASPAYIGIGGRYGATNDISNAIIEDLRFYDGLLSGKEIAEIYMSGVVNFLLANDLHFLKSAWCRRSKGDLSGLGGDTLYDEHGKGGNATVSGGDAFYYPTRKRLRK